MIKEIELMIHKNWCQKIIEYIKAHPNCQHTDILHDTRIGVYPILTLVSSMLERGTIKQTENGLYISES